MRVLVTGAAGFIGFHATTALLARGDAVCGVDNLNPYYDPALKRARLARLQQHERFSFVEADLADREALTAAWDAAEPQRCLHLAAQAGVRYSLESPLTYIHTNVVGFQHMLELCRERRPEHFVYASSSSVYGGIEEMPFREDMQIDRPVSLYAATKASNELVASSYAHLFGLPTAGLRFFTVYGPWGRPDMALFKFAERMRRGESIPVYNHGDMQRDFTYVDDIVAGAIAALDHPEVGAIYNLGRGEPVNLLEMIRLLEEAMEVKADLELLPMQPGDVQSTFADIGRARETLGYEPKTSLAEGIQHFYAWLREWWNEREA